VWLSSFLLHGGILECGIFLSQHPKVEQETVGIKTILKKEKESSLPKLL